MDSENNDNNETIVHASFEGVKALGGGRVGGYAVLFTDEDSPDLTGDYFTKSTYFGPATTTMALYNHGKDETIGGLILDPVATVKRDDVGVWVEAQLDLRNKYVAAIYKLAERGLLGWSTGTAPHLVKRTQKSSGAWHIDTWPLGLDSSLTPSPAEPRTLAQAIKALGLDNEIQKTNDKEGIKMDKNKEIEAEAPAENVDAMARLDGVEATLKAVGDAVMNLTKAVGAVNEPGMNAAKSAPAFNKTRLGDDEVKAYTHFLRTGDSSGIKASNDTDMNIGTAADGGNAVPTGHFNEIIARRDEMMLSNKLGLRKIPGIGTTVNVPTDNEADGEFVSTAEAGTFDRDAPAISQVAMTLVKYTKRVELSVELLQDEDSRLMAFLSDFVGRGMAKTHNNLLVTEVAANGTQFKQFASASAIAAGEVQDIIYNNDLEPYLDDASVAWVTRPSTFGDIVSLQGNDFIYDRTPQGDGRGRTLAGFPVAFSQKVAAPAASAKSILFGNFYYVGWREAPGFTVLRDPYSKASTGQVVLHYYFRTVYKVLQAEAIGYGQQATA